MLRTPPPVLVYIRTINFACCVNRSPDIVLFPLEVLTRAAGSLYKTGGVAKRLEMLITERVLPLGEAGAAGRSRDGIASSLWAPAAGGAEAFEAHRGRLTRVYVGLDKRMS